MPTEMYQCDICFAIYTTLEEATLCEEEHQAEMDTEILPTIKMEKQEG